MEEATVTSKGQITIPKPVRDQLHLEAGSKVLFLLEENEVILKPKVKDPLQGLLNLRKKWEEEGKLLSQNQFQILMKEGKRGWSKFE